LITNASLDFESSSSAHLRRRRMLQTRSRTSRRNKVNVRWLPVELIIEIFRAVRPVSDQGYYNNLRKFALSNKEWTAIAQAELFRNVILENRSKTGQFLELVRDNKELRSYAESAISIRLGGRSMKDYDAGGLGDDLDEIALYCPHVVEISCHRVDVRLEYFRKSSMFHLIRSSMLTIISTGRKHEEFGQAQPRMWIYPAAFDFRSTNQAPHSPHYSAITRLRRHPISP
jgi:hypothetical protein